MIQPVARPTTEAANPFLKGPCFATGHHDACREVMLLPGGAWWRCPCGCGHREAKKDRRREAKG